MTPKTFHKKQIAVESEDPVQPNVCILLTSSGLQAPVVACENCVTGAALCNVNQPCQAAVLTNGPMTQAIFAEEDMEIRLEAKEKDCYVDLNIVAIGNGGLGHSAGGGSGYVETGTVRVSIKQPVLEVTVGNSTLLSGNPSQVAAGVVAAPAWAEAWVARAVLAVVLVVEQPLVLAALTEIATNIR